jgi:hypothetical protein
MPRGIPKNKVSMKKHEEVVAQLRQTEEAGATLQTQLNQLTRENKKIQDELTEALVNRQTATGLVKRLPHAGDENFNGTVFSADSLDVVRLKIGKVIIEIVGSGE